MQTKLFIFIFFVYLNTLSLNAQHKGTDVINYDIQIELSDEHDSIFVKERILLNPNWNSEYKLDLFSMEESGKGMRVVWSNAVELKHEKDVITFKLPVNPAASNYLDLEYKGIPANGLIIGKNKFGERTFFADNWPNRARHWMACHDHPSDKAFVNYTVVAPRHYSCIATGVLINSDTLDSEKIRWIYNSKDLLPSKVMVIGVAEMTQKELETEFPFPLSSWVYPEDANKISDLDAAIPVLEYFNGLIASYPFEKLANVQSTTMFGGMENAGNIFYDENAFTGKNSMEDLIAHEIAHQWFGNSASEAGWPHLWLSEGFATYFADLYMGHQYGDELFKSRLKKERQQVIRFYDRQATPVVDEHAKDLMTLLNPNSYQKGAWILHMLRNEIGDSAFFGGIRNYYENYQFKNAFTKDLREDMEAAAGISLSKFFDQWLYQSGHPVIKVDTKQKRSKISVCISQQQNQFIFEFPLMVRFHNTDGTFEDKTFNIKEKSNSFEIRTSSKLKSVELDPNVQLLFHQFGK